MGLGFAILGRGSWILTLELKVMGPEFRVLGFAVGGMGDIDMLSALTFKVI